MKFRNLGRALLAVAGAVGITLGLTSCSADHTVGYIYVLGTTVNGQVGGQINALKEDNNNGELSNVKGSPTTSGGSNPIRAVIPSGDRFMYVLNAGVPSTEDSTGSVTYTSANIQLFSIGGYGQLSQQIQYPSQGYGSTRIAVNSSGTYLFVLDEYAPVGITNGGTTSPTGNGTTYSADYPCLGSDGFYHPTGDITVYSIDTNTGRLALQTNQRQQNLTYFPVGCFPVDFRVTASYIYTMDAGSTSNNDVETVNVQALGSTGQLTPTQTGNIRITNGNSSVAISAVNGDNASKYIYLIDTLNDNLYLYTIGTNGALVSVAGSDPYNNASNTLATGPVQSVVDSTAKYLYVVNGGLASGTTTGNADVGGYSIDATTGYLDTILSNSPTSLTSSTDVQNGATGNGTVSGPVCIFEDPTNQYIYVAGSVDSSITGRKIDPNTGVLSPLNKSYTFPTVGTPSWCLGISSNL